MKTRINELIEFLGVTQGRFCEQIGVTPAILSHLQSGRNKPSLDLVTKILSTFPTVSSDWLLFGVGDMIRRKDPLPTSTSIADDGGSTDMIIPSVVVKEVPKPIAHITVFYKDGTYCNFISE